jgi:hypothetical protein
MPLQTVALKKNRGGTSPVSKISDNEDATPPLGNSEELSVKHSVGDAIPEFDHAPENGSKVPSAIRRQDAGDVLPDQPAGPQSCSQPKIFEGQVATVVRQSASEAGNAEGLAGRAADKKVNCVILPCFDRREIAVQRDVGVVVREHGAWEGIDLRQERRAPAKRMPSYASGLDAGADGAVFHTARRVMRPREHV